MVNKIKKMMTDKFRSVCTRTVLKSTVRYAAAAGIISAAVLFAIAPVSCRMNEEGIELLSGDYESPQIQSFKACGPSELKLVCTEPVTVTSASVSNAAAAQSGGTASSSVLPDSTTSSSASSAGDSEGDAKSGNTIAVTASYDDAGTGVTLALASATDIGVSYELSGTMQDKDGNTLTFSLPFTGFNDHPARMVLNEVRSEHTATKPEFVELYVLKGGNTAGLEIVSGADGDDEKYSFPIMEVKTGEYITVHYRTVEGQKWANETGSDLTLADTPDSVPTTTATGTKAAKALVAVQPSARDLWLENTSARIAKTDVILLENTAGDSTVLDAVLYSVSGKTAWSSKSLAAAAEKSFASGVWKGSALPSDAVVSDNVTSSRTLCRTNLASLIAAEDAGSSVVSSASDWAVVASGCSSPGYVNSTSLYSAGEGQ